MCGYYLKDQILELLRSLPPFSFVVPEEVAKEITDSTQASILQKTLLSGLLREVQLSSIPELGIYAELVRTLGSGEAACFALAEYRGWLIVSDEKQRFIERRRGSGVAPGRQQHRAEGVLLDRVARDGRSKLRSECECGPAGGLFELPGSGFLNRGLSVVGSQGTPSAVAADCGRMTPFMEVTHNLSQQATHCSVRLARSARRTGSLVQTANSQVTKAASKAGWVGYSHIL